MLLKFIDIRNFFFFLSFTFLLLFHFEKHKSPLAASMFHIHTHTEAHTNLYLNEISYLCEIYVYSTQSIVTFCVVALLCWTKKKSIKKKENWYIRKIKSYVVCLHFIFILLLFVRFIFVQCVCGSLQKQNV